MEPIEKTKKLAQRRPAESRALLAGAVVAIALWAFSLEPPPEVVAAMVVLVGAVPGIVTWWRER